MSSSSSSPFVVVVANHSVCAAALLILHVIVIIIVIVIVAKMRPNARCRPCGPPPATQQAVRVMETYPVNPEQVYHDSRSRNPTGRPLASGSFTGRHKSWDYIQQMSEDPHGATATTMTTPTAPPPQPSSSTQACRGLPARSPSRDSSPEVQQRVISELARRLHHAVNQKLEQRRAAAESTRRLHEFPPFAVPPEAKALPSRLQDLQDLMAARRGPRHASLEDLSLEDLIQRVAAMNAGEQVHRPNPSCPEPIPPPAPSAALTPPPTSCTAPPPDDFATDSKEMSGDVFDRRDEEVAAPAAQRTAAGPATTDAPIGALRMMDAQIAKTNKSRLAEDTGLMRISRLVGLTTFHRGVFPCTKKRGRSGHWIGTDDGDRVPSSSAIMQGDAIQHWLCSFLPGDGKEPDADLNVPFTFAVLRDTRKGLDDGQPLSAQWRHESLTKAARLQRNARHSRYRLANNEDSFSTLIGSLTAMVQAQYGSNLSEEQRELAKRKLRMLREKEKEKEKERDDLMPYVRNSFVDKVQRGPGSAARPNSAGTAVFNDVPRVPLTLPVGARYVPGVGFVDVNNNKIEMSPEKEAELLKLVQRLQGDKSDGSLSLTQEDVDRLHGMEDEIHEVEDSMVAALPAPPAMDSPGASRAPLSLGSDSLDDTLGQTLTMKEAATLRGKSEVPEAGQSSRSPPPPPSARGTGTDLDGGPPPMSSESGSVGSARRREMRSLSTTDDNTSLDLFLARFPESKKHVQLRKDANAVLSSLEPLTNNCSMSAFDNPLGSGTDSPPPVSISSHGSFPSSAMEPPVRGFFLDEAILRERFTREAEEDHKVLTAERNRLRQEVEKQRVTLSTFGHDIEYLSYGDKERTCDEYAADLTRDVNAYAKLHNLRLNELEIAQEEQRALQARSKVGSGFLAQFGGARASTRSVACQVTEEDLGFIDETVRLAEEQMEDLMYHERALLDNIRLATIAVANVMSFHASLELESTCKECFYLFEQPRTLWPCGHTFCQQCLAGMYNGSDELICAECGSVCDVGYTPNLSMEVVARYQVVQDAEEKNGAKRGKKLTLEGVLRRLLNDLLATQKNCRQSPPVKTLKERRMESGDNNNAAHYVERLVAQGTFEDPYPYLHDMDGECQWRGGGRCGDMKEVKIPGFGFGFGFRFRSLDSHPAARIQRVNDVSVCRPTSSARQRNTESTALSIAVAAAQSYD
eukprot:gene6514-4691_t